MHFKNNIFLLILTLLFFSCNPGKEEVVSFDDISSGSKKDYDKDSISKITKVGLYADSLSDLSKNLIDSLEFDRKLIFPLDSVLFSDRFGAKKTEKWYLKTEKDSLVFFHWEFKDSIKTLNTFYNWIDCYGKNCKSIHVGDEVAFSKRATLFLIQDKHFFFIESNQKIDFERMLEVFDNSKWNKKWKHIIYQAPKKKAKWFKRDLEGKLI